ncbi:MAG: ABC transporter permease [Janthinobacterium lividum]
MTDTPHSGGIDMNGPAAFPKLGSTRTTAGKIMAAFRRHPVWMVGTALAAFFTMRSPFFFTANNLSNAMLECSLVGFLAVGMTPVLVSGNIDLSVGSIAGLAACLAIGLQPFGLYTALAAGLGAGLALGALNGLAVERTGVNSFIVTLAASIGYRGLIYSYTGDSSLSPTDDRLTDFSYVAIGPVTVIPILFLVSVTIFQVVLKASIHGRNTYAVGGNRAAAENAGVPVRRTIIANFALSGLMAGVCGIAMAANLGAATPTFGQDYELWAVIAVVLGGTRLRGGLGSLLGTLAAVLTLGILRNGLTLLGVSPFVVPMIMGGTLIAVLIADHQISRGTNSRSGE